jgi:hydrogenase maturation protein HypF
VDRVGRRDLGLPGFTAAQVFCGRRIKILVQMLTQGVNAPMTTSIGRLFDGVSSMCGLNHINQFEGQAPMALEHSIRSHGDLSAYSFLMYNTEEEHNDIIMDDDLCWIIDWRPILQEMISDWRTKKTVDIIAEKIS